MNIAIGSLNYDIILQVKECLSSMKSSLYLYRVGFGCRVDAVRAP